MLVACSWLLLPSVFLSSVTEKLLCWVEVRRRLSSLIGLSFVVCFFFRAVIHQHREAPSYRTSQDSPYHDTASAVSDAWCGPFLDHKLLCSPFIRLCSHRSGTSLCWVHLFKEPDPEHWRLSSLFCFVLFLTCFQAKSDLSFPFLNVTRGMYLVVSSLFTFSRVFLTSVDVVKASFLFRMLWSSALVVFLWLPGRLMLLSSQVLWFENFQLTLFSYTGSFFSYLFWRIAFMK